MDELLSYLCSGVTRTLPTWIAPGAVASPRFRAFLEAHRDKIRKKLRAAGDEDALRDVATELTVAYLLLQERRFDVAFEPYAAEKGRAPDFAVTFRSGLRFNVEVTRLRGPAPGGPACGALGASGSIVEPGAPAALGTTEGTATTNKLISTLCNKVRQMPPSAINLLVITADGPCSSNAVDDAVRFLKKHAGRKDEIFFQRRGFADARDFLKHYARLSAVLARGALSPDFAPSGWRGSEKAIGPAWDTKRRLREATSHGDLLWRNKEARHPLPADVALACFRSLCPPLAPQ